MTGVIEKCNKNRAEYFFIQGDDGIRYFGHRHQAIDRNNTSTHKTKVGRSELIFTILLFIAFIYYTQLLTYAFGMYGFKY